MQLKKVGAKYIGTIPIGDKEKLIIEFKGIRFSGFDNIRTLISATYITKDGEKRSFASPVIITQPHRIREFARITSDILKIRQDSIEKTISIYAYELISDLYSVGTPEPLEIRERTQSSFLIEGFVLENLLTILFARGGAGKSFLSLLAAIAVQNADKLPDDFPLKALKRANTMYLDWESDKEEMSRRYTRIVQGMRLGDLKPPLYTSVVRPLSDIIDDIATICTEHDIKFVIIDSVGLASGGSIEDASTSITFFRAVRELTDNGISVLALTHMSKSAMKDDLKTPIGSVYYENMPRLIWQMKSETEEIGKIRMQLLLRKTNVGRLQNFGFNLYFGQDTVVIERAYHEDLEVENDEKTNIEIVLETLQKNPMGMLMSELAQETGINKNELRRILMKLKKQEKVYVSGRKWLYNYDGNDEPPF